MTTRPLRATLIPAFVLAVFATMVGRDVRPAALGVALTAQGRGGGAASTPASSSASTPASRLPDVEWRTYGGDLDEPLIIA